MFVLEVLVCKTHFLTVVFLPLSKNCHGHGNSRLILEKNGRNSCVAINLSHNQNFPLNTWHWLFQVHGPLSMTFDLMVTFNSPRDIYHISLAANKRLDQKLWAITKMLPKNLTLAPKSLLTPICDLWPYGDLQLPKRHLPPKFGCKQTFRSKVMSHNQNAPCLWPLTWRWPCCLVKCVTSHL